MSMIRFGPAGNSEAFYEEGHKHTYQQPEWLSKMGLNAFEYSFGRGVRIKEESAQKIRVEADKFGIQISVHAPYYINLAGEGEERYVKNLMYFLQSMQAAKWLGAKRVVFHPGSCAKIDRTVASSRVKECLVRILKEADEAGYGDLILCPETMGKINQVGDLNEVIEFCLLDERLLPTIDFGHLHARGVGAIQSLEDYSFILDEIKNRLGSERGKNFHVHFSKIEYTKSGERMHRTFDDEGYGPDFEPLAQLIVQRDLTPHIICESKGTMAKDALTMKKIYEQMKAVKES